MRDHAEVHKRNPAHWGGAVYKKDMEGVSAANDTLERLVLP